MWPWKMDKGDTNGNNPEYIFQWHLTRHGCVKAAALSASMWYAKSKLHIIMSVLATQIESNDAQYSGSGMVFG